MQNLPLQLSPQIGKGRYANFPRGDLGASGKVFMLGYEECKPEYRIERNGFPLWTLEFIAAGHGFYQEGTSMRSLGHGNVFTYGPGIGQHFGNEPERPFRKYFLVYTGASYPEAWQTIGLEPGRLLDLGNTVPIISIFDQMLDERWQSDSQTLAIIDGLERVLMALMSRHQRTSRGVKTGSRKVYDLAMEILQRDYRSLHSLADLAQRSGYSGEYLCRIFRKYHGESPYQVLLHRKMSAAWLLLRDGQLQVRAVAREVGYEDPLHFSRVFRKVMGRSPSDVKTR
ncbi:MAG: helix-turn-helix transcriptional regulator [Puniceicoccales bacterium]